MMSFTRAASIAAMLMFASACGSGNGTKSWRPVAESERVWFIEDLLVRVEPDGAVSVTVQEERSDARGVGTVRLARVTPEDAARSPHVRLARARALYALAERLVSDPSASYEVALRGVEVLGTFMLPGVVDETQTKIWLAADVRERDPSRVAEAARMVRDALRTRLRLYTRRWHAEAE
jgi:hypothetical protein